MSSAAQESAFWLVGPFDLGTPECGPRDTSRAFGGMISPMS